MHRRLLLAIGASALIVAGMFPAATFAASPKAAPSHVDVSKIDPSFRPMMVDGNKPVTVVLQLAGKSALAAGGTRTEQRSHADALANAQATISRAVAKTGAKVVGSYRYAYNGLRIQTTTGKLADLAAIKGVVAVRPLRVYARDNTIGVPAIGAPTAWGVSGATGEGVTIAVIDTGIDYTHATFGGEGTALAYTSNDPTTIEPLSFPTEKVIAGEDLAGDNYDANGALGSPFPNPDADPLDCAGHGSHVSGTAAGFGVKTDHTTFGGPYDATTIGDGSGFIVGPGVAPDAKLVALKVFGCEGSTDLVVDALEWVANYNASNNDPIDVVNMSLGSSFGTNNDPDAVATNTLVASGVVVVASAGNSGPIPYITGAPAAATKAISVAAMDVYPTLPMAAIDMPTTADIPAINQNAFPTLPVSGNLDVLEDGVGGVKLACDAADYVGTSGKIVAVKRGGCPFVDMGALAADAGAVGIIMINRDNTNPGDLPTFIGYNPEIFNIPMIGTDKVAQADLLAAEGGLITLNANGTQANPTFRQIASFSSSGPRFGDSALKADVAAPGVNILSTLVGSGWKGTTLSGTSMAAPMTSGAAALVIQEHPTWTPLSVKAALSNTADGAAVIGYTPLRAGSGKIRVDRAARANVVATTSDGTASLSYGYVQAGGAWSASKHITITNDGGSAAVYTLASSSSAVTLTPTSVTVKAHSSVSITAKASLSATSAANICSADPFDAHPCTGLYSRSGVITATPHSAKTGQYALRVPFLFVPRGVSSVTASRSSTWSTSAGRTTGRLILSNTGNHSGDADIFALGVTDGAGDGKDGTDVRATGVQTLSMETFLGVTDDTDRGLVFAVNMHDRFSSASPHEIDIAVDTTGDKVADFIVFAADIGLVKTGTFSGDFVNFVYDVNADTILPDAWFADAPLNGSTIRMPLLASQLGLSAGNGSFSYRVVAYNGFSGWPDSTGWAQAFDAFSPKIASGYFIPIAAKHATSKGVFFFRSANPKGWLVVTMDDRNGAAQADVVPIPAP
jgi:minor extracellular serine protease Vpr